MELKGKEDGTLIWYRGHQSNEFDLMPGLFRGVPTEGYRDRQRLWRWEQDLYWDFSARARQLHGGGMKDWDILFSMQHFGTPTRLLDWTEVLAVAVYFAILNWWNGKPGDPSLAEQTPCVWLLEPYNLNMSFLKVDDPNESDIIYPPNLAARIDREDWDYGDLLTQKGIGWDDPVAIFPRQQNDRVHAQRGWFTMHGDDLTPINKHMRHQEFLRKVDLPIPAIPAARRFLELAGYNHYTLFPDLTNLSKYLKETITART
jgi:hypothetical protein